MTAVPLVLAGLKTGDWTTADWIGIGLGLGGLIVSIGGFWIAIWQIKKTRTAARAAADAATQTARALVQNHLLFLIPELVRLIAEAEAAIDAPNPQRAGELLTSWRLGASRARGLLRARGDVPRSLATAFTAAFTTVTETKALLRQPDVNVAQASEPALRAIDKVMDEISDLGGQMLADPQGD